MVATINGDQLLASEQASTQVTVVEPSADVSVAVSGPTTASRNKRFSYTVEVRNDGPDTARAVMLTDALSGGQRQRIDIMSVSSTAGTCSRSGATVVCSIGDLLTGAEATVTIVLRVTGTGTVVDTATAASSTPDPNAADNTATISTTVT